MSDDRPDLYLGLVCAVGTDLSEIKRQLRAQLEVVKYAEVPVKVSSAIQEALDLEVPADNDFERVKTLMEGGDTLRAYSPDAIGVTALIVSQIRAARGDTGASRSRAFVIDSLKNPKEISALDKLYSRSFYSIAIYQSKDTRRANLANKIARSRHQHVQEAHFAEADELISRDEKGEEESGQSVRDTFPKADFFVDASKPITPQIRRFVQLIFGEPFTTPTDDEYMMFIAKATALRSCDLSRQVGAVIANQGHEIIATGCNEVPKPGGGFFVEGRSGIKDNRDKVEGHDPNFNEVKRSISEFIEILMETTYIDKRLDKNEIAEELLHGQYKRLMGDARVRNLIEFGRVVHAEMHALSQAALLGRKVAGGTLYCTVYPCHLCAKHIIAAGIDEVVYIEPYPKSLTETLYRSEIVADWDGNEAAEQRPKEVKFRAFHGISPTLYHRVFSHRPRKDSYGAIAEWVPESALPVGAPPDISDARFEEYVASQVAETVEKIHTASQDGQLGEHDVGNTVESADNARS